MKNKDENQRLIIKTPGNLAAGLELNTEFWVANIERLTERFNAWVGQ
jgi:hypothetical protein